MFKVIDSLADFNQAIEQNSAVLFYFSHQNCNICKVLKPKIEEIIENEFPELKLYYCDTINSPELAAQNRIFAVPALLFFFDSKEYIRKSRNFGLDETKNEIRRPYQMIFDK